jgi:arylsulfatase A-like enzyme
LAAAGLAVLSGCTSAHRVGAVAHASNTSAAARPNIVFVLTDDLAWNLLPYMPQVQRLQRDGVTFTNYTVTDSLCCPSRSSTFTGEYPHDTGVFTNVAPDGGFAVFRARGNEQHTYATALQATGYTTGLMGKYLNGYRPTDRFAGRPYQAPGWSQWDVAGYAYREYNYSLDHDGTVLHYGAAARDYLTDVLAGKASAFIRGAAAAHKPFALEIATYAPHSPYTPAPADLADFPDLRAPRSAAFDKLPANAPAWLAHQPPLSALDKASIDAAFRERAQAVQAVDRLIGTVRASLAAAGVAGDTYLVFSSDNGFHMGEYRLTPGKQTAFDTDIRVPLIVVGPGVPPHATRSEIVENVDLAPTFEELAGVPVAKTVDGHSLVPVLHGPPASGWRTAALIEHHGPDFATGDPDAQTPRNGDPISYEALRTVRYTYVEYATGEVEYYDRVADPYELHNIAAKLTPARRAALHAALARLRTCHNQGECWAAGHVTG